MEGSSVRVVKIYFMRISTLKVDVFLFLLMTTTKALGDTYITSLGLHRSLNIKETQEEFERWKEEGRKARNLES